MKKILLSFVTALTLAAVICLSVGVSVFASHPPFEASAGVFTPGDVLGDVLYSDITAYINGHVVPTSITDGTTMVVAEDLRNYGFDVVWDGEARALRISPNSALPFSPMQVERSDMPVGAFKMHFVYTDIKTYLSGEIVESIAVDGQTLIDFELLSRYGSLGWNGDTRELHLTVESNNEEPVNEQSGTQAEQVPEEPQEESTTAETGNAARDADGVPTERREYWEAGGPLVNQGRGGLTIRWSRILNDALRHYNPYMDLRIFARNVGQFRDNPSFNVVAIRNSDIIGVARDAFIYMGDGPDFIDIYVFEHVNGQIVSFAEAEKVFETIGLLHSGSNLTEWEYLTMHQWTIFAIIYYNIDTDQSLVIIQDAILARFAPSFFE
jgi:hypothetical protein